MEAPAIIPVNCQYYLPEISFAELISVIVEAIDYVKIISGIVSSNCGSDYFPRLHCLCHESGQVITSEYFWGILVVRPKATSRSA